MHCLLKPNPESTPTRSQCPRLQLSAEPRRSAHAISGRMAGICGGTLRPRSRSNHLPRGAGRGRHDPSERTAETAQVKPGFKQGTGRLRFRRKLWAKTVFFVRRTELFLASVVLSCQQMSSKFLSNNQR